jgi:hypothetical protein
MQTVSSVSGRAGADGYDLSFRLSGVDVVYTDESLHREAFRVSGKYMGNLGREFLAQKRVYCRSVHFRPQAVQQQDSTRSRQIGKDCNIHIANSAVALLSRAE